jgi:hypothetical protein
VPYEKHINFEGFIQVENLENSSDYELIPVFIKTSKNINNYHFRPFIIQQFILILQQWFLTFERILKLPLLP